LTNQSENLSRLSFLYSLLARCVTCAAGIALDSTTVDPTAWEERFRAPVAFLPDWSPQAPDRVVYASNESIWQVHAWDAATGARRRVTDHPVGVVDGTPTLDGDGISWFQDETGESARHDIGWPTGRAADPSRRRGSRFVGAARDHAVH
jgi:hypothetical protein